jgi:hypothetical protein
MIYRLIDDILSSPSPSEDNIESPSVCTNKAYKEHRKKEKSKEATSHNQGNSVEGRELEEGQTFQY